MSTQSDITFATLGVAEPLVRAADELGYEVPSSIQVAAIPPLLAGRDLLGQAQTGTGKTAAFALPLLSRLDLILRQPQLLVLTPTRELAIQVAEAMQTYARHLPGFHVLPIYGGQSMDAQLRPLRRGVHAVVGTPGRIADHLRRGTLKLDALTAVVLDEADEMLRMGFIEAVSSILEQTPANRQLALFSATMPAAVAAIARRHLRDPAEIHIETRTTTVDTVTQRFWQVTGVHKLDAITRILEVEDFDAMLVFVRTKTATVELAERLEARGYSCSALNGDMNQALRERTVERLRRGEVDIVVATDVAARGLDVDRISHVINYDVPWDVEAYVHRIGRTGRAGREGQAILFVAPRERRMLRAIEQSTRQSITPMRLPTREDIADRRTAQFKQTITETIASQDLGPFRELLNSYRQEQDGDMDEISAALAFLVQKERPLLPDISDEAAPDNRKPAARAAPSAPPPVTTDIHRNDPRAGRKKTKTYRPERWGTGTIDKAVVEPSVSVAAAADSVRRADQSHTVSPAGHGSTATPERELHRERGSKGSSGTERYLRYRIAVGRQHGAEARHIVGAIANEVGLDGRHIGRIEIEATHTVVELPEGIPKPLFQHLKAVWVCGQQLKIRLEDDAFPDAGYRSRATAAANDDGISASPPLSASPVENGARPSTFKATAASPNPDPFRPAGLGRNPADGGSRSHRRSDSRPSRPAAVGNSDAPTEDVVKPPRRETTRPSRAVSPAPGKAGAKRADSRSGFPAKPRYEGKTPRRADFDKVPRKPRLETTSDGSGLATPPPRPSKGSQDIDKRSSGGPVGSAARGGYPHHGKPPARNVGQANKPPRAGTGPRQQRAEKPISPGAKARMERTVKSRGTGRKVYVAKSGAGATPGARKKLKVPTKPA